MIMTPQYKMIDDLITEMFGEENPPSKSLRHGFHAFADYLITKTQSLGVTLHPYEAAEDMDIKQRALHQDQFFDVSLLTDQTPDTKEK